MKKGKDGYYHSKVVPAPGVKPIYFRAKTLREFNERRQQIIDEYVSGKSTQDMTFRAVVQEWWDVVKAPRIRRASTRSVYLSSMRHIDLPEQKLTKAVRYSDLQKCLDEMKGYSYNAVAAVRRTLIEICDYAASEGLMSGNPARSLQMPKVKPNKERRALDAGTVERLLAAAAEHPDGLYVFLLYYTGMRRGEAAGLRWEDVDFESQRINLTRAAAFREDEKDRYSSMKTEKSKRSIPILPALLPILSRERGLPGVWVLNRSGNPIAASDLQITWIDIMHDAGLTEPNQRYFDSKAAYESKHQGRAFRPPKPHSSELVPLFTPHTLRHNFATACYRAEIDPGVTMRLLGHSSYNTTMTIYTDMDNALDTGVDPDDHLRDELQKVAEKLHYRRRMVL